MPDSLRLEPSQSKYEIHEIVDLPYRVVLYARDDLLFDSVDCRIPGVLDFEVSDRTAPDLLERSSLRVVDYDSLITALCSELANRYVVLHDHEGIFECLRFELPPEQLLDIGHVLIRNDALRYGGTCCCRTRNHCAPLSALWGPILGDVVPEDPVACAVGLLRLFDSVSFILSAPAPRETASIVPSLVWRASPTNVRTLEESMGLEVTTASLQAARVLRSAHPLVLEKLPVRRELPFVFRLEVFSGRDDRRVQTLNALCRMLPLAGPAFVQALVNGEI